MAGWLVPLVHMLGPVVRVTLDAHLEDEVIELHELLGLEELALPILDEGQEGVDALVLHLENNRAVSTI